jgi:hypothetical protein
MRLPASPAGEASLSVPSKGLSWELRGIGVVALGLLPHPAGDASYQRQHRHQTAQYPHARYEPPSCWCVSSAVFSPGRSSELTRRTRSCW